MTQEVVTFATVFLGLVVGSQPVEVLVRHDVASVELRLDGAEIAEIAGPPWVADCELGERLEPRRLEAVAFGADGDELGRAEQWLNIAHPPADVQLLLDRDDATGRLFAQLSWNSVEFEDPERVRATFDGLEIPAADPRRIELPPHDAEQLHYLRIDVDFSENITTTVERTFGGSFTDTIDSELTAVPVRLEKGVKEPGATGWLRARGRPLDVVDVVSGPADIVVIRDQSVQLDLDRMVRRSVGSSRWAAPLKRGYSVQFLRPVAELQRRRGTDVHLFAPRILSPKSGGLLHLLTHVRDARVPDPLQRLADAVAVAGVNVSANGHRRAVVLLLGPQPADNSRHTPESVRLYLRQLRVPLFVWTTAPESETAWGPAADVSTRSKFERETRQVVKRLEAQRIAWVEGVYQPPEVSLAPDADGIHLAGS